MTPPERANYLIKELGLQKAIDHTTWVIQGCEKQITRDRDLEHWRDVKRELEARKELYLQK
jgi:hypothetical protein